MFRVMNGIAPACAPAESTGGSAPDCRLDTSALQTPGDLEGPSVARAHVVQTLRSLLQPERFRDYCPNGLQVEGRDTIRRIVSGVTACEALIDAAVACQADALLVHHGLFWKGDDPCVVGPRRRRLQKLLDAGINVLAYHLPLDAHETLGNNAQLAARAGWTAEGRFGEDQIGWVGRLDTPQTVAAVAWRLAELSGRQPTVVGSPERQVRRLAWCTGGAQKWIDAAVAEGVDLYVSGEISEPTTHVAREADVAYIAAGHHATERYGVQAVGAHLAAMFGIDHRFVDIDNPA